MHAATRVPPSVAGLSQLQRACFIGSAAASAPTALPIGPWANSLRQLATSLDAVLLSGELLAAAGKLEA